MKWIGMAVFSTLWVAMSIPMFSMFHEARADNAPGVTCHCFGPPLPVPCKPNPSCSGYKIDEASNEYACDWISKNPEKEHIVYVFHAVAHCQDLGGENEGGYDDVHCISHRGIFAAAPNLRGVFGVENIGKAAYACEEDTGVPRSILVLGTHIEDKEWYAANCPNYLHWTTWHAPYARAGAVKGIPGQSNVPTSCYGWKL